MVASLVRRKRAPDTKRAHFKWKMPSPRLEGEKAVLVRHERCFSQEASSIQYEELAYI